MAINDQDEKILATQEKNEPAEIGKERAMDRNETREPEMTAINQDNKNPEENEPTPGLSEEEREAIAAIRATKKITSEGFIVYGDEEPTAMFSEPPKVILDVSDKGVFDGEEVVHVEEYEYAPLPLPEVKTKQPMIGVVTGTFDILHQGHIYMIRQAQKRCDKLVVAIESDARVRLAKGKYRPIFKQKERKRRLERALADGTVVEILPETFEDENVRRKWLRKRHIRLLFTTRFDMHLKNKQMAMLEVGGRVEFLPNHNSVSTTQLLEGRRTPKFLVYDSDAKIIERYRGRHG